MKNTTWQSELQQSITDIGELCRILVIPQCAVQTDLPLLVPRPFVDLMERNNPQDPLLLQVLPQIEENKIVHGFSKDPLDEIAVSNGGVILNKYAGRTLLLAHQECAIHCRFCFRRHFPRIPTASNIESFLESIENNTTVEEVILSGGDPLMLEDETLDSLFQVILRIKHIQRIRIHSRLPIALPNRITEQLAQILTLPIPVYLVLHINHPNELSEAFLKQRELLIKPILLAQTVLLRHINDNTETLYRLFEGLINARIIPYYIHQLDHVAGAAHFEVEPTEGLRILAELRERLPGYALPTYVREICSKMCKEVVTETSKRGCVNF